MANPDIESGFDDAVPKAQESLRGSVGPIGAEGLPGPDWVPEGEVNHLAGPPSAKHEGDRELEPVAHLGNPTWFDLDAKQDLRDVDFDSLYPTS